MFVDAAFLHLNLIIQAGAVHNGLYLAKKKGKTVKVDIYVIEKTFYGFFFSLKEEFTCLFCRSSRNT